MTPKHIKTIRAWLELSQQELADEIGVTQTTVGRWEVGARRPNGPATEKLIHMWQRVQGEFATERVA